MGILLEIYRDCSAKSQQVLQCDILFGRRSRLGLSKLFPAMLRKDHPLKGKPSLIHCKFFPPLTGAQGKMAASKTNTASWMKQSPADRSGISLAWRIQGDFPDRLT